MRILNINRQAAIEILTNSGPTSFKIVRTDGLTAGQILCSNAEELPEGWWLLRYFHKCSKTIMEKWFKTADDIPNKIGAHLICRSCGTVGLQVEDCP